MGARGKKPAGSVVQISAVKRPEPSKHLTDDQAKVWRQVVDSMPADWFQRGSLALLEAYCAHVESASHIAELIKGHLADRDSDRWLYVYNKLLIMQERETRAMSALATRMRLTQQSRFSAYKTTGPKTPPPWNH